MKLAMGFGLTIVLLLSARLNATEEHLRGVLEKTAKPGACAQITDALREIYYINNTPEAQKTLQELMGKKVLLTGIVEQHAGDADYFFKLIKAETQDKSDTTAPTPPAPIPTNTDTGTGTNVPLAPPPNK